MFMINLLFILSIIIIFSEIRLRQLREAEQAERDEELAQAQQGPPNQQEPN